MRTNVFTVSTILAVVAATLIAAGQPTGASLPLAARTSVAHSGSSRGHAARGHHGQPPGGGATAPSPTPGRHAVIPETSQTPEPVIPTSSAPPAPPTSTPTGTDTPEPTPVATPRPTPPPPPPTPSPAPPPPGCTGPPLTSQADVRANTSYCGGVVHSRIVLAGGDSWTGGDVSGVATGQQQGAVQCGNPCTLIDMDVHDNPNAFAGIYAPMGGYLSGPMLVSGGRVSGSGSLGIGGSAINQLTISGVEIDHNGAFASCGFEGGGFKGVNHGSRVTDNYVHDNNCAGIWYDVGADNNEIDHNRVVNNAEAGIEYEVSYHARIHDNQVSGNGHNVHCGWLWNAGINVNSSSNVEVYNNSLAGNCNGIGETQQNRGGNYILANVDVHNNVISSSGKTGAVQDNGAALATRNLTWENNSFNGGAVFCGLSC